MIWENGNETFLITVRHISHLLCWRKYLHTEKKFFWPSWFIHSLFNENKKIIVTHSHALNTLATPRPIIAMTKQHINTPLRSQRRRKFDKRPGSRQNFKFCQNYKNTSLFSNCATKSSSRENFKFCQNCKNSTNFGDALATRQHEQQSTKMAWIITFHTVVLILYL